MTQVLLLELNEVNFEHIRFFASRGDVPNLAGLIRDHGLSETVSEQSYEELEPWIQWVTAHTGLTLREHGVFRLGDIRGRGLQQIWEALEQSGLRVGAICPMNAENRTRNASFFVPDPWTPTSVSASHLLAKVYEAVAQAVNDNAKSRLGASSLAWLAAGLCRYACVRNYGKYVKLAATAPTTPWARAMLLDLLLADIFVAETRRSSPHFASLFLNAAAHIQHHYMFNSAAYRGERRNPDWYVARTQDPVGEVYRLYDYIVGQLRRLFPSARLMIATGLHQEPHADLTFYWRLRDHTDFMRRLGVPFQRIATRMSRDFIVECATEEEAATAARIISSAKHDTGQVLFEVDNRGRDLFVMLTWDRDIDGDFGFTVGEKRFSGFRKDVAFVAIKNGEHNGVGYFLDTGRSAPVPSAVFPLRELPEIVCAALGVHWSHRAAQDKDRAA